MRSQFVVLAVFALFACAICYTLGCRSGTKQSPSEEEQRGLVVITLDGYKKAEAKNWPRVQSQLEVEILSLTRDYENRFGIPTGTNSFARQFAEAEIIADQVEKQMVPFNSIGAALGLGSDVTVQVETKK